MPRFAGNTSTSATSGAYSSPLNIVSLILVNKSASSITVNASVIEGSTNLWITPLNVSLSAGQAYQDDTVHKLLTGQQIYVLVSDNCDYEFVLENAG